jgi:hypothetical protein
MNNCIRRRYANPASDPRGSEVAAATGSPYAAGLGCLLSNMLAEVRASCEGRRQSGQQKMQSGPVHAFESDMHQTSSKRLIKAPHSRKLHISV